MLELRTSVVVRCRSFEMVTDSNGGNAYHDQNAIKKPNLSKSVSHREPGGSSQVPSFSDVPADKGCRSEKKARYRTYQLKNHTRPYMLMGFKPGIDLALWLIGLTSGALNNSAALYIVAIL